MFRLLKFDKCNKPAHKKITFSHEVPNINSSYKKCLMNFQKGNTRLNEIVKFCATK